MVHPAGLGSALFVFILGFSWQPVHSFYSCVRRNRHNGIAFIVSSSSRREMMTDRFDADKEDEWTAVPKKKKTDRVTNRKGSGNRAVKERKNSYIEILAPTNNSSDTGTEHQPQHYEPFLVLLVGLPGSGKSTFAQSLVASMPEKFCRINQDELKTRPKCERKLERVLSIPTSQQLGQQQLGQQRRCPIIDRCNFDQTQRSTWYRMAEAAPGQGVSATALKPPNEDSATDNPQTEECGTKPVATPTAAATTTTTTTTRSFEANLEAIKLTSSPPATATATTKGIPVDVVLLDLPYEECMRRCSLRKGHETIKTPQQASRVLKTLRKQWSPPNHPKNRKERFKYRSLTVVRTDRERIECLRRILDQTH